VDNLLVCLRCNLPPVRLKSPDGSKGFCDQCWQEIYRAGKCIVCGTKNELSPLLKWCGITLEEICYYCFSTMEYETDETNVHSKLRKEQDPGVPQT
jgi:hypothetical protein